MILQLPQIRIETQPALIGIQTQPSNLEIEQPQADMQMRQPQAELSINKMPSRLTIDQSAAWAAMDLKPILQRIKESASKGYQSWLQYVGKAAQQGDQMMKIENGGNTLAHLAKVNGETPYKDFNIGWIPPLFSVKIDYKPSELEMNWETHQAIIEARPNSPKFHYTPSNLDIYLRQKNSIKIDFVGSNIDTRK